VIPTAVDINRYYPQEDKEKEYPKVNLGWLGSPSTINMLKKIDNVFIRLSNYIDFCLIVVTDFNRCSKINIPKVKVINKQWKAEEELFDLNSFDIGLMPLENNERSKGKCSFKALQYMSVGIPCIISNIGNNPEVLDDGVEGYTYKNENELIEKIIILSKDKEKRKEMGKKGREKVEKYYATAIVFKKLFNFIFK
ncbi:MAG: glycosyltransferase, partial [Petrotogales bacterium]